MQVWLFRLSIAQKSFDLEETYHHEHQKRAPYVFDAYQAVMFRYVHIGTNIFSHTHVNSSSLHNYALNHLLSVYIPTSSTNLSRCLFTHTFS